MLHMQVRTLAWKIVSVCITAAVTLGATTVTSPAASPDAASGITEAATANATPTAPATATATADSPAQDLSLTIYNDDLALVQDRRTVHLTGGRQRLEFEQVSARIRSDTASLAARNLTIIEQNFDYDLLTPANLLRKAIGHEVTVVETNPTTGAETSERARVLTAYGGVVLQRGEKIDVLRDDGRPARVIFDPIPDNLRAHPTLSVTVNGAHRGTEPVVLSYLTPGLGWRADYTALYDEKSSKIDVQGWLTLTNTTGTTYENATTLLVAGAPNDDSHTDMPHFRFNPWGTHAVVLAPGTEAGTRGRLGDYYLYPLAERTTIADRETKQLTFLDVHDIPAEHAYAFLNGWLQESSSPASARAIYLFSTRGRGGLGDQLPAGTLRLYTRDAAGTPQFIGESRIDATPMGSTVALATGDAFDVKVKPTVVARTLEGRVWRTDMRYELTNALPTPARVVLQQERSSWAHITAESQASHLRGNTVTEWTVVLPPQGSQTITIRFED
jgi:hypothetical protein